MTRATTEGVGRVERLREEMTFILDQQRRAVVEIEKHEADIASMRRFLTALVSRQRELDQQIQKEAPNEMP